MAKLLPGYRGLGDSARRVVNEATGEILSRRQYAQRVKRGGALTNEQLAKLNKAQAPIESISRPTKGRSSIQKLAPEVKEEIAKARIESVEQKKRREAREKEEKRFEKKLEKLKEEASKRIKVPRVTLSLLRPGTKGRRIAFNDYSDYLQIIEDSRKSGHVLAVGLGAEGVDSRDEGLRKIAFTVFPMRPVREIIPEKEFYSAFTSEIQSRSYFVFLRYWAHLAFKRESYEKRAKTGTRSKQNPKGRKK
jgi:hypothetical protein